MPTLLCVPIMVLNPDQALDDALLARARGAEIVEYRIDGLFKGRDDQADVRAIGSLVADSPLPCVITCRPAWEGGEYEGDEDARMALFERLCGLDRPPNYIDVELAALDRTPGAHARISRMFPPGADRAPALILSVHDFNHRPGDLFKKLSAMRSADAARVHKVAWRARSLRDNLELFELLCERDRPTIALGMGEFGLMSRVLAPKFGALLTFAALRTESATAPGQPTIDELLNLYRLRAIDRETRVFGVVGWPVAHSRSPHVHNAAFEAIEENAVYLPMPVPGSGGGWEHFKATLGALLDDARLDFSGCSVTIPHKEHLFRFAREDQSRDWLIDPIAQRIGAANTLVISREHRHSVHNTDAEGILAPLRARLGALQGRRVAILGAGGVARAGAVALADAGATVLIHTRTRPRGEALVAHVNELQGPHEGKASLAGPDDLPSCEVIINATPVGMTGAEDSASSPVAEEILSSLHETTIVFDTVYTPAITPLLRAASERGLTTIGGGEMFIAQAALQFRLWTGRDAPIALMARVLEETLPG